LRIAAPAQLPLGIVAVPAERWWSLPERAQEAVLCLLASMIAASVVEEEGNDDVEH
jgi:hypothetical protein